MFKNLKFLNEQKANANILKLIHEYKNNEVGKEVWKEKKK